VTLVAGWSGASHTSAPLTPRERSAKTTSRTLLIVGAAMTVVALAATLILIRAPHNAALRRVRWLTPLRPTALVVARLRRGNRLFHRGAAVRPGGRYGRWRLCKRWASVAPRGSTRATLLLSPSEHAEQAAHIANQTGGRVFLFLIPMTLRCDYPTARPRVRFAE
jgi:hypothetical protein